MLVELIFMKSQLTIVSLLTLSTTLYGQIIKLESDNPAPRVGDRFSISFIIEKNDLDSMDVTTDPVDRVLVQSMNRIGDGDIKISEKSITEPGPFKIGPILIPLNNKVYKTSTLDLVISPKLPGNIDEGIWIRQLNFQGTEYIILEQRHPGQMKPKIDSNGRTIYGMSTGDATWTKLRMSQVGTEFDIEEKSSRSAIQPIDIGDALYMVTVYSYRSRNPRNKELVIDKSLLTNFPEKGHFEVARVNN